jgi:hypothetical protein
MSVNLIYAMSRMTYHASRMRTSYLIQEMHSKILVGQIGKNFKTNLGITGFAYANGYKLSEARLNVWV